MSVTAADAFATAFAARQQDARPGVIPYITAGFPEHDSLAGLLLAAQRGGAMAVEVGIPFSDPLADGPTIQRAGARALRNGMSLTHALAQVRDARAGGLRIPVAVMTYLNPVLAHGVDELCADARDAGVDGLIVPDLPHGEAGAVRGACRSAAMALIPLVAPTTRPDRLHDICAQAAGFVYCVSVTGVTGARERVPDEAVSLLDAVRRETALPRALGFGLSRPEHIESLRGHAEAAVIGSALIDHIDQHADDAAAAVERFCAAMTAAG